MYACIIVYMYYLRVRHHLDSVVRLLVGKVPGADGDNEQEEEEDQPEIEAAGRRPGLLHPSVLVRQVGSVVILVSAKGWGG